MDVGTYVDISDESAVTSTAGADAAVGRREGRGYVICTRHAQPLGRCRRIHPEEAAAEACVLPRSIHRFLQNDRRLPSAIFEIFNLCDVAQTRQFVLVQGCQAHCS